MSENPSNPEPNRPSETNPPPKFDGASFDQHAASMTHSGQSALRNAMLINGGACVAILGFIGATLNAPNDPVPTTGLAIAMLFYASGVLLGAIASGANYLHVRTEALVSSATRGAMNPNVTEAESTVAIAAVRSVAGQSDRLHLAAVGMVALAYISFFVGSMVTFFSIMCG